MSILDSTFETGEFIGNSEIKKQITSQSKFNSKYSEYYLYGERILVNSEIEQYNPLPIELFNENYKIEKTIYSQGLSPTLINLGVDLKNNKKVAIKVLTKSKLHHSFQHELAKNELSIHHSLSKLCNNIVNVPEYFEDANSYAMVMEYSDDPNYFEDLLENRYTPINNERTLKSYAMDILNALNEIHKYNIIHCDIKPVNFLLFKSEEQGEGVEEGGLNESIDSYDPNLYLKLTDFGLSHLISQGNNKAYMKFHCGTFSYTAPEITKECYIDQSVDMWSFGICLYQMAVAYLPTAIKQYKFGKGPIPFRNCDWTDFDFPKIKNLIESCLQIEPHKRITAAEAINHPWFDV